MNGEKPTCVLHMLNLFVLFCFFFLQQDGLRMKNAASWNSLAAGGSSSSVKKTNAMQTFELYRKQAKEKEERVSEGLVDTSAYSKL